MSATTIDADFVARYLSERLNAGVEVKGLVKFPRGVSRETWFAECAVDRAGAREAESFVFRRDLPGGSVCPATLRFEYEIYSRLARSAVPVAKPLWYEDDEAWLADGRDFYVREHVDGTWEVPHFLDGDESHDELRVEISKEHLRKLALVHTCDWEGLGFGDIMAVPPVPAACATTAVERLVGTLAEFQIEPFPLVIEAVEWLTDHAPTDAPRVSLLKGTNGLGEEIFRGTEIVAMSDWELASLGDPASDFAHVQDFIPEISRQGEVIWGLDAALEYYEGISGLHVTRQSIDYYRTVFNLEMIVFAHNAALPLTDGSDHLARLAWVSTEVLHWAKLLLALGTGVFNAPGEED